MVGRTVESVGVREYSFGDYRIDLAGYQLWQGDQPLTLTPKVFDTLVVLIRHHDRAVSKEELLKAVWPDASVTEDSLTQSISVLRKTLGDDTTHPRFIATIARRGYRFIAPVTEVADENAAQELILPATPAPRLPAELPAASGKSVWTPWVGGASLGLLIGLLIAFGGGLSWLRLTPAKTATSAETPALRFSVSAPSATSRVSGSALSPDGRYLLLLAEESESGIAKMWIRSLTSGQLWSIPETEGATRPFWSPDSQFVGFIRAGRLQKVGINSRNSPQTIAAIDTRTAGVSWGARGVIVFAPRGSGLYSVSASGGNPAPLTTLNSSEKEIAHSTPQFLPDGNHFLYFADSSQPNHRGTWMGSLDSKQSQRVLGARAIFAEPGYLIYLQDRLLKAVAFDPSHPSVHGDPWTISDVELSDGSGDDPSLLNASFSVSSNGLLAYTGLNLTPQVKAVDRSGHELSVVDIATPFYSPVLSPDGKQLLLASRDATRGVWLVDLARSVATRIIPDGRRTLWSPDGTQIIFNADRNGAHSFFMRPAAGASDDRLLLTEPYSIAPNDWSRDGRYLLYTSFIPNQKNAMWILPLFGDHKARPYLQAAGFNEMQGEISPDGAWVAYVSDESGRWEVYLQSFPEPTTERILSTNGGVEPHWTRDGKELYYMDGERNIMSVAITLGAVPRIERPRMLFRAPVFSPSLAVSNQFAVSPDNREFFFASAARKKAEGDEVTVISAWPRLLSH